MGRIEQTQSHYVDLTFHFFHAACRRLRTGFNKWPRNTTSLSTPPGQLAEKLTEPESSWRVPNLRTSFWVFKGKAKEKLTILTMSGDPGFENMHVDAYAQLFVTGRIIFCGSHGSKASRPHPAPVTPVSTSQTAKFPAKEPTRILEHSLLTHSSFPCIKHLWGRKNTPLHLQTKQLYQIWAFLRAFLCEANHIDRSKPQMTTKATNPSGTRRTSCQSVFALALQQAAVRFVSRFSRFERLE